MSVGRSCGLAHSNLDYSAPADESSDICKNILVVDDDPVIRRFLKRLLAREWDVDMATNARDGADMMVSKRYHAVVTDYEMPGENGLWLLEFAKRYFPATRRILSSGSDDNDMDTFMIDGLVEYSLPKPVDPKRLSAVLGQGSPKLDSI